MNIKIKKSALQNVLLNLLNEAEAPALPTEQPAEAAEDPEKRAGKEFSEKVRELQQMKTGDVFAVGDRKFKKKAGSFYLAGAQEGLETEKLLSFVKPEFQKEIGKKLAKDAKEGTGAAGVTIMGNQFIDSTERSATFKLGGTEGGSTVWEDMSGIPVQVIAQYYFQTEKGVEFGSDQAGALAADVLGSTGANQLVYRSDELMIVIDPATSNMHIMSADFNGNDPLMAMKTLLTQIKLNDKVGDDPNDESQGSNEYPDIRAGYNTYLKPDGSGEKYSVPLRNFDLGALRKAIGSVRTIFSKFVDLFNTDDIEMNFVFSPWGPSMTRSKVFGSDAFEGGTGAMTSRAINRLRDTGLFNEEALPRAGAGTYNVRTDDRQDLVTLVTGTTATPVTVTPVDGRTGVNVAGLKTSFGVKFADDDKDTYDNTLGDAYLLYMNGAMSVVLPKEAPSADVVKQAEAVGDPLAEICNKPVGMPVGVSVKDKAALFVFGRTDYLTNIAGFDATEYIKDVAIDVKEFYNKNRKYYDSAADKKIDLTVIGTADQRGGDAFNQGLSADRCTKFIADLATALAEPVASKCNITSIAVGETFWRGKPDKESEQKRAYKRFAKVYWCKIDQDKAEGTVEGYVKPVQAAATAAGESAAGATKTAGTGAPSKAANDKVSTPAKSLEPLKGVTLTDGSYTYKVESGQGPDTVKISGGPKKLTDFIWSQDIAGPERWDRFVTALLDKQKMSVSVTERGVAAPAGYGSAGGIARSGTPAQRDAIAMRGASNVLKDLAGVMLTDKSYVYKVANDSITVSGGSKGIMNSVLTLEMLGREKWFSLVANLSDSSRMYVFAGKVEAPAARGYRTLTPVKIVEGPYNGKPSIKLTETLVIYDDADGNVLKIVPNKKASK